MLGHRALTPEDYGTILKRRGWIIAVPAIILPIIAFGITFFVQPQFVSQTLVLIEQQKVPDEYVKPVVTEDLNARLASMKEQILSRSRLEPIIERFNLYGAGKMAMDDRVDMARKDVDIKPIRSEISRSGGLPGFFISFKARDARTAQAVCGEITSLFVSESLNAQTVSAEGTTDFLKAQLADAKRNLDDQDAKLAKFQESYAGKLPGEETSNMGMLTTLNTQLEAATQSLARMEQDKSYEESMLSLQQSQTSPSSPESKLAPQAQQVELQQLLSQESELTARYTDNYPDVVAVRRKIKELRAEMAKTPPPAPAPTASATTPNRTDSVSVQQMRAQLKALDQMIQQKRHDQAQIQTQIRIYQDRIQSSPQVQADFKNITRDYQTAQQFYDDLLKKMNQSKMATDLQRRQQGEQFRVMDPPNLPEEPAFPRRSLFLGAGLVAGLGLGLMIVALLEYRDTALRSERDIWAFTKLPTLAVVGYNAENMPVETKRRWKFGRRQPEITTGNKPLMNTGG